ncbi:TPA: hypothetical protein NJF88_002244 [Pseudomonas aeruginosa]|nr:hypothetical protein [Pseudomonas aeruginosa]
MTKANECTCPSGDGSLRHPCPAHPALVEQTGGDERAAFFKHLIGRHPAHETEIVRVVEHNHAAWKAWQARAALAQPSPASDLDPFNLAPHAEAFNEAPDEALKPEQAEAERPEVVAVMESNGAGGKRLAQRFPIVNVFVGDELMTVAQHERIVGALRAKADQLREALEWRKENQAGQRELLRSVTAERDAALARVAELEKQEPAAIVKGDGSIGAGFPAGTKLYAAPVAQAQHSVPEGYALIPTRETEAMHDAVMALLYKGVARTDTQKLLDAYIAAAPGKEGL